MFTPSRLILARQKRGLSKKELANLVGLSLQSISNFESENNKEIPSEKTLEKIAKALEFPIAFFQKTKIDFIATESASFRALSKMTASQRNSSLASGSLAFELNDWFELEFVLPRHELPDLRDETPESAAVYMRNLWQLGEEPIDNITHLLESNGIRIYYIAEDCHNVDAFSIWNNGTPFILLNTLKSGERSRFDAAHELAHLVLHKHGVPRSKNAEQEANLFAAEFLMPKTRMLSQGTYIPPFENLIKHKHYWKVSLSALAYRLRALGLLTEWQHRTLVIDISKNKYNVSEPMPLEKEISQIFSKIFAILKQEGMSKKMIAEKLSIPYKDFQKLTLGIMDIEGKNLGGGLPSSQFLKRIK